MLYALPCAWNRRSCWCASVVAVGLFPSSIAAQSGVVTRSVASGDRLRIEYRSGSGHESVVGRLVSSDGNRVVLERSSRRSSSTRAWRASHGDSSVIATSAIARVDRAIGEDGHALEGALIGAGAAAALVVAINYADDDTEPEWEFFSDAEEVAIAAGFIAVGALLGTALGSTYKTEHWQPVHLSALGIGVSIDGGDRKAFVVGIRF